MVNSINGCIFLWSFIIQDQPQLLAYKAYEQYLSNTLGRIELISIFFLDFRQWCALTALLESEEMPSAVSRQVLYLSMRREKSR